MRVWDIHPKHLCRKHLLAEHRELHGLWNILTKHGGKGGYSRHPETLRWVLEFDITLIAYKGDDGWVEGALKDAHKCLNNVKIPKADPECDYCNYVRAVSEKGR